MDQTLRGEHFFVETEELAQEVAEVMIMGIVVDHIIDIRLWQHDLFFEPCAIIEDFEQSTFTGTLRSEDRSDRSVVQYSAFANWTDISYFKCRYGSF